MIVRCGRGWCGTTLPSPDWPNRIPSHDLETLESNVPDVNLAGAILGGIEVGRIFIENSRHHAALIADSIQRRRSPSQLLSRS